jgi:hypothetical protein
MKAATGEAVIYGVRAVSEFEQLLARHDAILCGCKRPRFR